MLLICRLKFSFPSKCISNISTDGSDLICNCLIVNIEWNVCKAGLLSVVNNSWEFIWINNHFVFINQSVAMLLFNCNVSADLETVSPKVDRVLPSTML